MEIILHWLVTTQTNNWIPKWTEMGKHWASWLAILKLRKCLGPTECRNINVIKISEPHHKKVHTKISKFTKFEHGWIDNNWIAFKVVKIRDNFWALGKASPKPIHSILFLRIFKAFL
jgi:hypothetical protein